LVSPHDVLNFYLLNETGYQLFQPEGFLRGTPKTAG
jgi:hypothetical protein